MEPEERNVGDMDPKSGDQPAEFFLARRVTLSLPPPPDQSVARAEKAAKRMCDTIRGGTGKWAIDVFEVVA